MTALLINLRIDAREKFDFFKVTLSDIAGLFPECHIKIRGRYASECVEFARRHLGAALHAYQHLQERDWIAATLDMLSHVQARSVFLYLEDHKLVSSRERIERTLACFDELKLDYLCYSFFKASKLEINNLLPLGCVRHDVLSEFGLSAANVDVIGRISPNYYTFSLLSVVSVEYFRSILTADNKRIKIFSRIMNGVLARAFPYTRRRVMQKVNAIIAPFQMILCLYDPSSPFNLEKMWYESVPGERTWKYGVASEELFANYDDDNGAYGESLIKRGLYPFNGKDIGSDITGSKPGVVQRRRFERGQRYDCTYYSRHPRIRQAPVVGMNLVSGSVAVIYQGEAIPLATGETKHFYSNLGLVIECREPAEVELRVFDEAFQ